MQTIKPLIIGDLTVPLPIVQGGMGVGISMSGLASAVANEGGIGVISAACIGKLKGLSDIKALKAEIKKTRSLTKGVLGVNIMVALSDYLSLAKSAIEEKIDVLFVGAGLPLTLPSLITENCKTKLIPIVSSGKAAGLIIKWWKEKYNYTPDAFVLEGPLAGGHLGFSEEQIADPKLSLSNLLIDVLKHTEKENIPVIVAGGIYTGKDIYDFLKMGASGVQMATRFVATYECDASEEFKQAYINCKKENIKIIKSPVGLPGRAIANRFLSEVEKGNTSPSFCKYGCISTCKKQFSPYCIANALIASYKGDTENGLIFIGENGYRLDRIFSVKELIDLLKNEYICAKRSDE